MVPKPGEESLWHLSSTVYTLVLALASLVTDQLFFHKLIKKVSVFPQQQGSELGQGVYMVSRELIGFYHTDLENYSKS